MEFLGAVQIEVPAVKRSDMEDFYTKLLGLELVSRDGRESIVSLSGGALKLIKVNKQIRSKNLKTLRLTLEVDNVIPVKSRLLEAGVQVSGPKKVPGGLRAIGCYDPEGMLIRCIDRRADEALPEETLRKFSGRLAREAPEPEEAVEQALPAPEEPALVDEAPMPPTDVATAPLVSEANPVEPEAAPVSKKFVKPAPQPLDPELVVRLKSFLGRLEQDLNKIQEIMLGFAEGRLTMAAVNEDYANLYDRIARAFKKLTKLGVSLENHNPYENLLKFFLYWTRHLPTSKARRAYIEELYAEIIGAIPALLGKLEAGADPVTLFPGIRRD